MKIIFIETENVPQELINYSKQYNIALSSIDFELIDYKTIPYNPIDNTELELDEILTPEYLEKEIKKRPISVKQKYTIKIYVKSTENSQDKRIPDFSLVTNKSMSQLFILFKEDKDVPYYEAFIKDLKEEIIKKQLKNGFIIDLFDVNRDIFNNNILASLKVYGTYNFAQEKFLVAQAIEPIKERSDKLIAHYKKHFIPENENERVEHKKRGFLIETAENQLVLEYLKPKEGAEGLNCKGQFIPKVPPLINLKNKIKNGEGISLEENDDSIKYISTKSGYISINRNEISVKNELEIKEINFKKTGSIDTNKNADVHINVTEKDMTLDSIQGVEVEAKSVSIKGSVGHGAYIKSEDVVVNGQVHKSAIIESHKIKVNRLKGSLKGDEIDVDILEQGKIRGKIVKVNIANGGLIIGDIIHIKELKSNTIIMASKKIEVDTVSGEDNKLILDPFVKINRHELEMKLAKIKGLEKEIERIKSKINLIMNTIKREHKEYIELRNKIKILKEKRMVIQEYFFEKLNKFETMVKEVKELNVDLQGKERIFELLNIEIEKLGNDVKNCVLINHSSWPSYNKIIFKLGPGKELEHKTKNHERILEARVFMYEEGRYKFDFKKP